MKKFSMRVVLIISVLFIAFGSANVSIAQERDTTNKLPEEELGSLDTSNLIAEEVAQEKPAEVENLEEIPTTDELMQNPDVREQPVADSDDSDLTVVSSGAYWTIYRNTANGEYSMRMFGNVPSSRPTAWNSYLKSIKHIEIEEATLTGSFASYFRNNVFTVLESVRIERSNLSGVTSFEMAFYSPTLQKVIIRDNDYPTAPSLRTTEYMFGYTHKLTELDVSGLDTSAVTNMNCMFNYCSVLEELDVSNFDTSSVTTMRDMFGSSGKLEKLDVSNFDTSSVTTMQAMFYGCTSLEELDVSNFDTNSVTNMSYMFYNCAGLEELDVSNFDTSSVTNMYGTFVGCNSLEELDVSNFDTSSVTTMQAMFNACRALEKLDVSNFDTSSVTTMQAMFENCTGLGELDVSNFDTSSVTTMAYMFDGCTSLEELDLSNFDTSSVTTMAYMFQNCTALKSLYLDNFTTPKTMTGMFTGTTALTYLFASHNLRAFDGLANTRWYDEKNWVQFSNYKELQMYHEYQREPTGYRKGIFLSLTMDAMGGQFEEMEEQKVQNKVSGEYWEEMLPVKEGHYFDGWYLDQNFTNKFDFSLPATVSATIYAKWVENYTVIIPASISLNEASELKVEGINRGGKTLSVGLNYGKTTISESNKLTLSNTADTTVQCLAPLSWDGSETNPKNAILTLAPGSEITEGEAVMEIESPENIQAGKYTGNLVFSINYE
ncbi:TPA_asm: BspA family leucine-rich repeat surface protein [Listeria monocytogenes]|uniref:BspA family leucine-rich repeat surface protein n=1 Tax=Listeria monocytogenes TaxID=1639 RepID=UPI00086B8AE4|nr:BspA family leucine-rich repeat surface protein [Listeria monocytogenes]EAE3766862.1 BspA family leucine-rich repeat surface protein [Listeria monocytogenes serotype 1/2b]EAA0266873.1 BspA family leucine-rich repeat surface protein [Listeria monocytogenes]EAC2906271.1 BspA family leucine-rich repeat surface protein [Listeria monocytogenes]EAC3674880.1 BspA family leucine-rich repeat surface protein [Listeria monocytogenes]EAC4146459.1 BspA family leucine-rich repeat surface protein [Listeri